MGIGKRSSELTVPDKLILLWEDAIDFAISLVNQLLSNFSIQSKETLHWFSSQLIPRLNHKREVVSVLSSTQDITEEKSIFDQLQLNEEHVKT